MVVDRDAFLNELVSLPWEKDGLNCWSFVCLMRKTLFNDDSLPYYDGDKIRDKVGRLELVENHAARDFWQIVEQPQDGDLVMMTRAGSTREPDSHAGIYLITDGQGLVWHTDVFHGVTADTLMEVQMRRWKLVFFRRR